MILKEIIDIREVFSKIITKPISSKIAYKIAKFINNTEKDSEFYYEKIKDIINKYSEKDEQGNLIKLSNGIKINKNFEQNFKDDLKELQSIEYCSEIQTFSLEELEQIQFSVSDMIILDKIIK